MAYPIRTRITLGNFGKYLPKFGVIHDSTRRFTPIYGLHPTHFRTPACWIMYGTGLEFSMWHLQEFLFGVACGLTRVDSSSSHSQFRRVRSREALSSSSQYGMCRQSPRQSASTKRSAAGRPNLGQCQTRGVMATLHSLWASWQWTGTLSDGVPAAPSQAKSLARPVTLVLSGVRGAAVANPISLSVAGAFL